MDGLGSFYVNHQRDGSWNGSIGGAGTRFGSNR